jgi:hypothetical protein
MVCGWLVLVTSFSAVADSVLVEWTFDREGDPEGWGGANHIAGLRAEAGSLQGEITDWDPFVRSPALDLPANPRQRVEFRLRSDLGGQGEVFWTDTTEGEHGGFRGNWHTTFEVKGDGQWHDYVLYPYWTELTRLALLRLDLPRLPEDSGFRRSFALDSLRVVDVDMDTEESASLSWDFRGGDAGWQGDGLQAVPGADGVHLVTGADGPGWWLHPGLAGEIGDRIWVHVRMKVDRGTQGRLQWVCSEHSGLQDFSFPLHADGEFHSYNLDVDSKGGWQGELYRLGLQPSNTAGARAVVESVTVSDRPLGPAELACQYLELADAVNRAGQDAQLVLRLVNRGGTPVRRVRVADLDLPEGVRVTRWFGWRAMDDLMPQTPVEHRIPVRARRPVSGPVVVRVAGADGVSRLFRGHIEFTASPDVEPSDYVPEPRPVASDYEIGALYFPGWDSMAKWAPVIEHAPIRKPVLGWYEEGNPECVDWQIKWAVEHGIQFFLVDWYWSAGNIALDHWLKAFKQARYRHYLKWCMMWANHNQPNTHSMEDMEEVTRFWIREYFSMPEYYRIENKPVVMIWSVRDLGGADQALAALERSRELAREAGYDGIWYVAMKWPEAGTDRYLIERLRDLGYDMTSIYHYMHHGGDAEDPRNFAFDLVADSSYEHWQDWHEAGVLPFLPNLSTGWDSRPWHGERATVIHSRTVPLFRRICEDAKRFADETGVRRLVLGPLNEWGEGSYAEPNKEFGFGMYEAVRDTFCEEPAEGWPPALVPGDVGLGPYDYETLDQGSRLVWSFRRSTEGWGAAMGVVDLEARDGRLCFRTASMDPALSAYLRGVQASRIESVVIRMSQTGPELREGETAQLFWATTGAQISEATSLQVEIRRDGAVHEYVFPVSENPRWRGRVTQFRFDPCSNSDVQVEIEEIRLVEAER